MSDLTLKIFGIAILGALIGVIMRKWNPDVSLVFKVSVGVVLCIGCVTLLSPLIEALREIGEAAEISEQTSSCISVLLRALFVAMLSHICANICRDCGENSIAGYVELGGKIEIMLLSVPLFLEVLDLALELIEMSG